MKIRRVEYPINNEMHPHLKDVRDVYIVDESIQVMVAYVEIYIHIRIIRLYSSGLCNSRTQQRIYKIAGGALFTAPP